MTYRPRDLHRESNTMEMVKRRMTTRYSLEPMTVLVLVVCFCLFSASALLFKSLGTLDDMTHYLVARYAWAHPQLLVDIWGRPAYTILSSPFAQFGVQAAGFFNILVSVLACYVAAKIAAILQVRSWPAAVFTAIQPFFLRLSSSTLTEPLFALLLAAAILLYFRCHFFQSALCVSLLPLTRLEGFAFVIVWLFLLIRRGELRAAISLFLFPVLWNAGGFVVTTDPLFLWRYNPYYTSGDYGYGTWTHYIWLWPAINGPILLPLISVGLLCGITRRGNLLHILTILFFIIQTVVYRIGYGSAGYERFFVCIAPLLGVIAAQGLHYLFEEAPALRRDMHTNNLVLGSLKQTAMPIVILILLVGQTILITWWLFQRNPPVGRLHVIASWLVAFLAIVMTIRRRRPNRILWTALIVLLTAITFLYTTRWVRPDQVDTAFEALWADAAHWYATSEWQRQPVLALHPFFWIAANRDPYTRLDRFNWDQLDPQSASLGTIILWDSDLGSKKRRCSVDFFNADQFRIIRSWETLHEDTKFQIIAFEKVNTLPPCDAS